jgi:hypothetical protein
MKHLKILLLSSALLATISCAAKPLNSGAASVTVTPNKPDSSCRYIGPVNGDEGGWLTGGYTSHKNLEIGAMNDLRNEAYKIGANYVELITNRAGNFGLNQTSTVLSGNAYHCK